MSKRCEWGCGQNRHYHPAFKINTGKGECNVVLVGASEPRQYLSIDVGDTQVLVEGAALKALARRILRTK